MKNYVWNQASATIYVYWSDSQSEVKGVTERVQRKLPPYTQDSSLRHSAITAIFMGFKEVHPGEPNEWDVGSETMYISILFNNGRALPDSARFLCDTLPNPTRNNFIVDINEQFYSTTEELPAHWRALLDQHPQQKTVSAHQPSTRRLSNAAPNNIYYYASDDRTDVSRQTEKIRWQLPPHKSNEALQNFPNIATRFGFICLPSGNETFVRGSNITIMIQNGHGAPVRRLCDAHPTQAERIRVTQDSKINWH